MRWTLSTALVGVVSSIILTTTPTFALSSTEVNTLAKSVTVRILGGDASGSGVLIRKEGKLYTLLTAAHVLTENQSFKVITEKGQQYTLIPASIRRHKAADLAIAQFSAPLSYPVIALGDLSKVVEGTPSYVAGYPAQTEALTDSIYHFSSGQITAKATKPFRDGYGLVYTNTTLPGMSGGPVLNVNGQLIGIHGRADAQAQLQDEQLNSKIYVKSGVNLGIPVETAFFLLPKEKFTAAPTSPPLPGASPIAVRPPINQTLLNDLFRQADFRRRQRDYAGAIALFDQIIRIDPTNITAYMERGDTNLFMQEFLAAVVDFDQVIQIDPNIGEAYYNRGIAYLRSGSPQESLESFKIAAEKFKAQGKTEKYKAAKEHMKGF
jgi:serine protease Do